MNRPSFSMKIVIKMPKPSKKICEASLRWILGVRWRRNVHKYNLYNQEAITKYPEVFDHGHTNTTLLWSIQQAKVIDEIGLDKWLKTEQALGYGHILQVTNLSPLSKALK